MSAVYNICGHSNTADTSYLTSTSDRSKLNVEKIEDSNFGHSNANNDINEYMINKLHVGFSRK